MLKLSYLVFFSFRFVASLKNRSDEEELQFTTDMINGNFSNYSAWHNRRYASLAILFGIGFSVVKKDLLREYYLAPLMNYEVLFGTLLL